MKIPSELAFAIFIALLLALAALVGSHWHTLAPAQYILVEGKLIEYDQTAYQNQKVCYTLEASPKNFLSAQNIQFETWVNNKLTYSEPLYLYEEAEIISRCIPAQNFSEETNLVEIYLGTTNLFFHVSQSQNPKPQIPNPELEIISISEKDSRIEFSIKNADTSKYSPITITINNTLDHRTYPTKKNQTYKEKINLEEGTDNNISLTYLSASAQQSIKTTPVPKIPLPAGLLLFTLSLLIFVGFVFVRRTFAERFALATASTFSLFIIEPFALNLLNLLSLTSFTVIFLLTLAIIAYICRNRVEMNWTNILQYKPSALEVIAVLVIVVIAIFFHLQTVGHFSFWNVFYERQAATVAETFSLPVFDDLSYLGRGNSFVPGYFFISASLSWLTGTSGTPLFAMILILADIFLLFATLYFTESLHLNRQQGLLTFLLIITGLFPLLNFTYSPRHTIALAMVLTTLAVLIKGHSRAAPVIAGILLAVSAYIQIPLLGIFVALYIIAAREYNWKRLFLTLAIGAAGFLLFFTPHLLSFGIPYEIQTNEWGYLINFTPLNLAIDIAALISFFIFILAIDLVKRKLPLDPYAIRLLAFIALGILIELFITFRWGMILVINLALLYTHWIPKEKLETPYINRLLGIVLILGIFSTLALTQVTPMPDQYQQPLYFLNKNTSTDANILADPLFGHATTALAERKVLADLMVEYADQNKIDSSYLFLRKKDYSVLETYKISHTLSQDNYINYKAIENDPLLERLEFRKLDKVFSNTQVSVHWVP